MFLYSACLTPYRRVKNSNCEPFNCFFYISPKLRFMIPLHFLYRITQYGNDTEICLIPYKSVLSYIWNLFNYLSALSWKGQNAQIDRQTDTRAVQGPWFHRFSKKKCIQKKQQWFFLVRSQVSRIGKRSNVKSYFRNHLASTNLSLGFHIHRDCRQLNTKLVSYKSLALH